MLERKPTHTPIPLFPPKVGVIRQALIERGLAEEPLKHPDQVARYLHMLHETVDTLSAQRGERKKVEFDDKVVGYMLDGFLEGIDTALEQYKWPTYPKITLRAMSSRPGGRNVLAGFVPQKEAREEMFLLYWVPMLFFSKLSGRGIKDRIKQSGIHERITTASLYRNMWFGVGAHEVIHFLQTHHAPGLLSAAITYHPDKSHEEYVNHPVEQQAFAFEREACIKRFGYCASDFLR